MRLLTVGHSTHPIETFVAMLKAHGVELLVDVRTIPKSRYNPQFNHDALAHSLADAKIAYIHMPGLGGLRQPLKDSMNTGWKNANFRGYADYMQTPGFVQNLEELIRAAASRTTVIMCAEAVPWRCHRSLIADALTARNILVEDILSESARKAHIYTSLAKVENGRVTYPGLL